MAIKIKTYRCKDKRKPGEGLRVGTVRYLPRGVKKEEYAALDYFDVWFPIVAPSKELIKKYKERGQDKDSLTWFKKSYLRELRASAEVRQTISLLAAISKKMAISIGCYCEDDRLCHRTVLASEIERATKED